MCGGEGRGDLRDHAALGERRQQRRGREGVERQQRVLRVVRHAQRLDLKRGNDRIERRCVARTAEREDGSYHWPWEVRQRIERAAAPTAGLGR